MDLHTLGDYTVLALAGMAGAVVRALVVNRGTIILWRKWENRRTGQRGIDLGILSSVFLGAVVGILVDQSPMTAFSWAISGTYLVEEIVKGKQSQTKQVIDRVMKGGKDADDSDSAS